MDEWLEMCYFYITGKIEKETLKKKNLYNIYNLLLLYFRNPFPLFQKNKIFVKCCCLNYRRQIVKNKN